MSNENPKGDAQAINLEQQKKRAKELLRAYRSGDLDAQQRFRAHATDGTRISLATAQFVVAREAGFPSWTRLKLHAVQSSQSREGLVETLLAAALRNDTAAIETALSIWPEATRNSLHVAAALVDEGAVTELLAAGAALGALPHSPRMSALAVLCHSRVGGPNAETRAARARIAEALIAAGADARECVDTWETPGGKLSVLAAAARHTESAELVRVLLDAGAELEPPGSTAGPPAPPLVCAALGGNLDCVALLITRGAPQWQAREALEVAIERNDREMTRALLGYGALPDEAGRWVGRNGGCLHAALMLGRDVDFLELLFEGGATLKSRDRDGRSPLQIAVRLGREDAEALFVRHGASLDEITSLDRLIGACVTGRRRDAEGVLAASPDLIEQALPSDHQMVCWAARNGRSEALELLLLVGLDANAVDDDGQPALHLAVERGDREAVLALLRCGASPLARNYENASPLELARLTRDAELREALLACLQDDVEDGEDDDLADHRDVEQRRLGATFEAAVAAMVRGDLAALTEQLDREPALARARSPRFHRATLLHYLSSNGTEVEVSPPNAGAIAQLLIDRGAEVDASCRMYGGGPDQTTLGLVVTSHFPEEAGTMRDLVTVLVRAGARTRGRDAKSGALEGAIAFGRASAVAALAECGVVPHDLAAAAAMGNLDAVERELQASSVERLRASGALSRAVENAAVFGRIDVLDRLFLCRPDLDARGDMGATALHRAAWTNRAESVRWLLAHGADPTLRDSTYQGTPADWARHGNAKAALEVLGSEGATG